MAESTLSERIFVSQLGNGQACNGTAEHPFPNLVDALGSLPQRLNPAAAPLAPAGKQQVTIEAIPKAGTTSDAPPSLQRVFVVDPALGEEDGDGSAEAPFGDLSTAIATIGQLERQGKLRIDPGQSIEINFRTPFTSTSNDRRKCRQERIVHGLLFLVTLAIIVPLVGILVHLIHGAWPALTWSFVTENPRNRMTAGGIWAPLMGTFYLVFFSLLVAAPIGILAGVYLNEYARDNWWTRAVNLAVVNLAGVPSIVHALFGVGALVIAAHLGESIMAASGTLAIMTLPVIITSTKEALAAVPMSFRMACWNLGASRWQTIRTIVLPNAISGILTGVILQVSRAAGETAPILFTGAAFSVRVPEEGLAAYFPYGLSDKCMALSYHLHTLLTQVQPPTKAAIAAGKSMPLEHLQYGTAVVLIGLVVAANSVSLVLRSILRSRKKW